jgi:prevent-host-death family protein
MERRESIVGVRELRARLSAYLRGVQRGGTVTIGDRRKRPLARLVPVARDAEAERLKDLARRGLIALGAGKPGARPPIKPRRPRRTVAWHRDRGRLLPACT